jgi:putative solute:sodium symporter small subunit
MSTPLTAAQRAYWRRTRLLTLGLLAVWFSVTFVAGYFADELNSVTFLGFPLGFYIFAQGALVIYLAIIFAYVTVMNRLDRRYGLGERH